MRNTASLRRWDAAVAAYLSSRRALGRLFHKEEVALRHIRAYMQRHQATDLTEGVFDSWRQQFCQLSTSTRVIRERTVYKFCRYRRRSEHHCFCPDPFSLTRQRPHPLPILIEHAQVHRLFKHLQQSASIRSHRRAVLRISIVLLYTAGLRISELAHLTLEDVDARAGVLRIRESKFHKSRWVPLSRSATIELRRYLAARPADAGTSRLLRAAPGRGYRKDALASSIRCVLRSSGIWAGTKRPRVHDFRHSFAVAALARWYRCDADLQTQLPRLAMYMGHVSIASTAYYLRLMPQVIALASRRFERSYGALIQGGAP